MHVIRSVEEWQQIRKKLAESCSIGFVPTMGCLHQGHASLLDIARVNNDVVVLSIFVNPTQFNDTTDYDVYPRKTDQDLLLAEQHGVDYVLLPTEQSMYPTGELFTIQTAHPMSKPFEGACRPGHFAGVLTVVMKLLQWVQPIRAYFGEKDYQQLILIRAMVKDFFMPIDIIACPIIREASGLPYSSRNQRLQPEEKETVQQAYQLLRQLNVQNLDEIKEKLAHMGLAIDYLSCEQARIFSAMRIAGIRLIDNFRIGELAC